MTSKVESVEQGTSMINIQGLYENENSRQVVKEKTSKTVMIKNNKSNDSPINSRGSRLQNHKEVKAKNLQKQNYQMVEIDDRNEYGSNEHTGPSPTHSLRKKDYIKNNQNTELDYIYGISNSAHVSPHRQQYYQHSSNISMRSTGHP